MNTQFFTAGKLAVLLIGMGGVMPVSGDVAPAPSPSPASGHEERVQPAITAYLHAPLCFETRDLGPGVPSHFLARGVGGDVFLTPRETMVRLPSRNHRVDPLNPSNLVGGRMSPAATVAQAGVSDAKPSSALVRITMVGGNPASVLTGLEELPAKMNYLLGQDSTRWRTQVATFGKVMCSQVYPGVDVVYYGSQGQLEYDFTVQPGADPRRIVLGFQGADRVELDAQGDLVIHAGTGQMRHHRPLVYQQINGVRHEINGGFALVNNTTTTTECQVAFTVGRYDPAQPLIIDPVLSFATLLGGSGDDRAYGVAADHAGNVYVTGQTASLDFPQAGPWVTKKGGSYDVFVAKFQADGSGLVYATYIGGDGNDCGFQVAVDEIGNAIVAGETQSTNFPVFQAFQDKYGGGARDGFALKLTANGSGLTYSTYLGGSGADRIACVALDAAGNAYVCGDTSSTNFPTVRPFQAQNHGTFDGFAAKFGPNGAVGYSTYLGGSGQYDCAVACAADSAGHAYLTGYSSSADFPTIHAMQSSLRGNYDAFVTKINPDGSDLIYSTFLGGSGDDVGRSIAVDPAGSVYVSGDTFSTNFPTLNPIQATLAGRRDVFVCKINPAGSRLVYSTYLGGSGEELASLALDAAGNACLVGLTTSTNFPSINALQPAYGGGTWDAFVTKIGPAGTNLVFSTFLGGSGSDQGTGIAVDDGGNILVCGSTSSTNFPTLKALQAQNRGGANDAFLVKISDRATASVAARVPPPTAPVETPTAKPPPVTTTPAPSVATTNQPPVIASPVIASTATNIPPPAITNVATTTVVTPATPTPVVVPPPEEATAKPVINTNTPAAAQSPPPPAANPPTSPLFGTNLIVNGDAEGGPASLSSYSSIPIPGWLVTNHLTVLRYGMPGGFPSTNDPGPGERGKNLFVGGPQDASAAAVQTVAVADIRSAVDQAQVEYTLAAYLGGTSAQKDNAVLKAAFEDENGAGLGEAIVGPVMPPDRDYKTGTVKVTTKGKLPAGTRKIQIRLEMTRLDGAYNDSFADNLSLVLSPSSTNP